MICAVRYDGFVQASSAFAFNCTSWPTVALELIEKRAPELLADVRALRHARAAVINRGSVARFVARSFCSKAGWRDARALVVRNDDVEAVSDETELNPLLVVPVKVVVNAL